MPFQPFTTITTTAIAIPTEHIDTDQIIPARFLKSTSRQGFGQNMFYDWRFSSNGTPKINNPFQKAPSGAQILIAGKNFGCGSSREHAAWAIVDYGFKAVISSYFADIFRNNALNNGLLPVEISPEFLEEIMQAITSDPQSLISIDLEQCFVTLLSSEHSETFPIASYKQYCLLHGMEDMDVITASLPQVEAYEQSRKTF